MAKKQTVLIADDTTVNRLLLSDILSGEYHILEAKDGRETIEILQREQDGIALLLLDILMPVMDGFEVLAWLHKNHWNGRIPVVIISSETTPSYISKGFEYGVSDYIIRPFIPELVQHRVSNTIMLHAGGFCPQMAASNADEVGEGQRTALPEQTLHQLDREKAKFQFLSAMSKSVVFDYDPARDVLTFSDRCQEEFGLPVVINDFKGSEYLKRSGRGELFQQVLEKIAAATVERPLVQCQVMLYTARNDKQWYDVMARTLWQEEQGSMVLCGVVGKLENIHQRMMERSWLQEKASHDGLTGLFHAQAARERVNALIEARGKGLAALLLIDLDNFKAANDSHGHQFGDEVLKQVAQMIRANIRRNDIGARVGGDEFLIYLNELPSEEAIRRQCRRIFQSLKGQCGDFRYTACMGVAVCPGHGKDYESLFHHADQALYAAKRAGRDRYQVYRDSCAEFDSSISPMDSAGAAWLPQQPEREGKGAVTPPVYWGNACAISRESEYSLLMSSLDVSVSKHMLDEHLTLVWANDRYYEMFGYTKEEYETLFHNQCDQFYGATQEEWKKLSDYIFQTLEGGAVKYEYVCRMRHRDGRKLWIKLMGSRIDEYVDNCALTYTVMMDITDQMQAQVEQAVTYNNFPGLISKFRVQEDGFYFVSANDRYFEVFRHETCYLRKQMTRESGLAPIEQNYERFRRGESVGFSIFQDDIHGRRVYMNVNGECVDWIDNDPVYLLLHADVTQLTEQNTELERLAFTDLVTGGMNGTRFDMVAGATIHATPPGSYVLVWLNMQKFKLINDMAGNASGNAALQYIHRVLRSHLRPGELVARTSADNYSLLLESGDNDTLSARLRAMVEDINSFNRNAERQYFMSFTAGICQADDPALEITQLQDRAHIARKEIQKMDNGSLCACKFYDDLERTKLLEEKEVENRMRPALRNREFVVYLQPKLSLASHTVEGAEALVRWRDPKGGLIQPNHFIPIFEKNGFIVQLDLYVLEEVCALFRKWLDQGLRVRTVSVNVSRLHFATPHFVEEYARICQRYGVPTSLIELEVTETIVFEDPEMFAGVVEEMHRYGFTCSMDDFGSGYSSLNVLKDINVDVLKLDRAFFGSERMDNERERDVVELVIDLAKKLKMKTVAEGVETLPQQSFLEETDCDLLQGYIFSRPLTVEDYEQLVFGRVVG